MKRSLILPLLLVLTSLSMAAEIPDPGTDIRVTNGDTLLVRVAHAVIDSVTFEDVYSKGGTDDSPDVILEMAISYVGTFSESQYPFTVGMADTTRWTAGTKKEYHRKDISACQARAQDVYEHVSGKVADYVKLRTTRGFTIYKVEIREELIRNFSQERRQLATQLAETKKNTTVILSSSWDFDLQLGVTSLGVDGFYITTPSVDLSWSKPSTRVDVTTGWIPAGDSERGHLSDATITATGTWFPEAGSFGFYTGWVMAEQYIDRNLKAINFSHGPTIGLALRDEFSLLLDWSLFLRLGYARINFAEVDADKRMDNGIIMSGHLGLSF